MRVLTFMYTALLGLIVSLHGASAYAQQGSQPQNQQRGSQSRGQQAAGSSSRLPGPGGTEQIAPAGSQFKQQVSYAIGLDFGRSMQRSGADLDFDQLAAGIADALQQAQPKMTDEQCRTVLTQFQQIMQQKAEARMADASTQNQDRGDEFLAENQTREGVQVTDSGLQYEVVEEGTGASPTASDTVRCHYEGTLIDGTVFDSSYKRGEPAEFPVGGVISGWTEALQMMKVGGKWKVYLPSDLAYGPRGAGGAIGPNETLIFTIELLGIAN